MKIIIKGSENSIKSLLKSNRLFIKKKGLIVEYDNEENKEVKEESFQDKIQKNIVKKIRGRKNKK